MPSGCSPPKLAGPGSALERPCHCLEGNGCGCAPATVGSSQEVAKRPRLRQRRSPASSLPAAHRRGANDRNRPEILLAKDLGKR